MITWGTGGNDRGYHLFWEWDWSQEWSTSLTLGTGMRFVATMSARGMSTRDVRGVSLMRMRGTRSPGLMNIMIAAAKVVFVYVSDSTVNVIGVESLVSPPHGEVTPISNFIVVWIHCGAHVSIHVLPQVSL